MAMKISGEKIMPEKIKDFGSEAVEEENKDPLDGVMAELPEVRAGRDLWQNEFHEFDVEKHTYEFVRFVTELSDDRNIRAAAWLHDIGKPVVATPKLDKEGKPLERAPGQPYHKFDDHEIVGEEMVKKMDPEIFINLGLDQEKIASLVGCHYIPMKGIKAMRETKNFIDFTSSFDDLDNKLGNISVSKEEVLDMFVADKLAQGKFCIDKEELFAIREALLKTDRTEADLTRLYDLQRQMYGNKE